MKIKNILLAATALLCATSASLGEAPTIIFRTEPATISIETPRSIAFASTTDALMGGPALSPPALYRGPSRETTATASGGDFRVCSDASCSVPVTSWTAAAVVRGGNYVQARTTSPSSPGATATMSFSVDDVHASFSVTTANDPATLTEFPDVSNATRGTRVTSLLSSFTGFSEAPISVSGGEYQICTSEGSCGSWTAVAGTIRKDETIRLAANASSTYGGTVQTSVTVGGPAHSVSTAWTITSERQPLALAGTSGSHNVSNGGTWNYSVTATGGSQPYTFTRTSGTLPSGITETSTASGYSLSGSTTAAGTYSYTITGRDGSGTTTTRNFNVTVAAAATATASPSSLTFGANGNTQTITVTGPNNCQLGAAGATNDINQAITLTSFGTRTVNGSTQTYSRITLQRRVSTRFSGIFRFTFCTGPYVTVDVPVSG